MVVKGDKYIGVKIFLCLPEYSEYTLNVVRRVPRRIEDYHAIGSNQIDSQTTGFSRDEKQTRSHVVGVVECVAPIFSIISRTLPIESKVITVNNPRADWIHFFFSQLKNVIIIKSNSLYRNKNLKYIPRFSEWLCWLHFANLPPRGTLQLAQGKREID